MDITERLIGQNINSAQIDSIYRIVKIDGKDMIITHDLIFDRLNLEIENNIIVNVYNG